ncbi:MAG: type II secretion system F family protein [Betaproteobacteria bacterium]|nr:type II secretion system F family protein [Betaproteobacteria bacterium]
MALYAYKAVAADGKTKSGLLDANNEVDLELRLKRIGLDLISGKPARKSRGAAGGTVQRRELITFFFNLEQLTHAGVPLLESLSDLRDTVANPRFREVIANLIENIEGGMRLSQAMAEHPGVFDNVFVSLIRAGEQSGRLPEVFRHITDSLKWSDEMAAQTKQVLMYPSFVLLVVVGITFFLMIYLVPQLAGFIKNMGQTLPAQTKALIFISGIFVKFWWLILAVPVVLAILVKLAATASPAVRYWVDDLKLRIWPVGPILRKIILARFASFFAMMYSSGITVLECVATSRDIAGNAVIAESLARAGRQIEEGKNLTQAFHDAGIFPPLVLRMLRVGEATGALDKALLNVSYFYDRDVKESVKRVQVMIEPTLTVVLGLLLGWIMLTVLAPIYDVITKIKL